MLAFEIFTTLIQHTVDFTCSRCLSEPIQVLNRKRQLSTAIEIHLYSMYGRFDPSKFLTGRFEIPWAVLFFRRGNEVGKANEGSEKSEDNPNTQITILFCSKSLSIIRPDGFTDC